MDNELHEIRIALKKRGLGTKDIAPKIGMNPNTFDQSLLRQTIKYAKVKEIAEILGCPIEIK